jgi:hypothetical protein
VSPLLFGYFLKPRKRDNKFLQDKRLTVCVSRWWAGRDSLREQKKPEARKMLENGAESHQSAARCVGTLLTLRLTCLFYEAIEYG